jgi:hypothetical protein
MEATMADYFTPTVVQQTIPHVDITPLEVILLSHIFTGEVDAAGWYFFAEQAPADILTIARQELQDGLNASRHIAGESNTLVETLLAEQPDAAEIDVDLTRTNYEFIFQDIVKRSDTLEYVSVASAWTCSKMRPDGFGGMAIVITADTVKGKSTLDFIQDFLAEEDIDP